MLPMPVSIRARLLLLVLAALLPALIGAGYFVATTYTEQREANQRLLRDTARALAMVVDLELRKRASNAYVLTGSQWLDDAPRLTPQDLQRFEQQAQRALRGMDGWIELRTADGVVLDTRQLSPPPAPSRAADLPAAPALPRADADAELADMRFVQPLRADGLADEAHAALVEPVQRGGRTVANLVLTIRARELQQLIDAQRLPAGWVGAVLDNRGRVVASHPLGQALIGFEASAPLRERLIAQREGQFEATLTPGQPSVGYFSSTSQGWTYLSAMPRAQYDGLLQPSMLQAVLSGAALLALATLGALWLARRIAAPVHALHGAAARLQAGRDVSLPASGIVEIDEVAAALTRAAQITRRDHAELERQVEHEVQRARHAEQRASQGQRVEALGRLTGGVSHDFNNLLGVISNAAHLIERHPAAGELELELGSIQRAIGVGTQLTQHLLRFAGQRPLQPRPVQLGSYLTGLQQLLHSVLGKRMTVSTQVAPRTHAVRVDGGELELALINLALNSRDAMPAGGELRVRARNATRDDTEGLAGHPDKPYVLITVGDDGVGLEPEVAEHVFEPFFTTKPVGKGSGLGLSQVLGFCTQAGGTARLDSTPGLGTTVSLLLPACTEAAGDSPGDVPGAQGAAIEAATVLDGVRVLLVEDNLELAPLAVALLRLNGMHAHHVADAAQALRLLQVPHEFDLVLSDVVMPGEFDGIELARRLRREQPGLPVILLSGYIGGAAQAPEFEVLHKPIGERELLRALARALRKV